MKIGTLQFLSRIWSLIRKIYIDEFEALKKKKKFKNWSELVFERFLNHWNDWIRPWFSKCLNQTIIFSARKQGKFENWHVGSLIISFLCFENLQINNETLT